MPTAENAKLQYEAGQTSYAMSALTDSGDRTTFRGAADFWSRRSGYAPVVRPDGLVTGGAVAVAASGTSDVVDTAALTAYIRGALVSVAASTDNSTPRADATYLVLSFASGGYTAAVAGDIGKAVVGGVTADSGTLIAYNNTTRQWLVDPDAPEDTFDDDDEAITITTGTGAGTLSAIGATPTYIIHSLTATAAGAVAVVNGDEGLAFSETRGAMGGPPLIPTTSIEIGQVRLSAGSAAAVAATELFSVVGTHTERFDYPLYDISYGDGAVNAGVTFTAALPAIHVGALPKNVWASYADPIFSDVQKSTDFVPPENSHSVNSTQIYGRTLGSSSTTLNQGSFTAYLEDGVQDGLVSLKDQILWFKFFPDRTQTPFVVTQGKLGISRSFPAGDNIQAACTISAESVGAEVSA